ncbi:MAG: monofunctional biosynthetic peptidoglycan transglycosylase [Pelagimonas sp.]|nr:monofunctional biosynthetic peptidoglycan transglycosylase [Pelagimonas sp.]
MILRVILFGGIALLALVLLFSVLNPPITHTMWSEQQRLGSIDRAWVPIEEIAPVVLRSVVVAEDANFCGHWGFDVGAIRAAIDAGGARGGSTITQQTVKNVFLWQGRSYLRKALEAVLTPVVELTWSKRRILEVYLNIAEFDTGVFGIEAAAQRYFGVAPDQLGPAQAAVLATVLPSPKKRNAARPTEAMKRKARQIRDGAATIRKDGRDDCFESR